MSRRDSHDCRHESDAWVDGFMEGQMFQHFMEEERKKPSGSGGHREFELYHQCKRIRTREERQDCVASSVIWMVVSLICLMLPLLLFRAAHVTLGVAVLAGMILCMELYGLVCLTTALSWSEAAASPCRDCPERENCDRKPLPEDTAQFEGCGRYQISLARTRCRDCAYHSGCAHALNSGCTAAKPAQCVFRPSGQNRRESESIRR